MLLRALTLSVCIAAALTACSKKEESAAPAAPAAPSAMTAPAPRVDGVRNYASADEYKGACANAVSDIRARLAELAAFTGTPTIDSVYKPFNEMTLELANAWYETNLLQEVHPLKAMRDQGDLCDQDFSKVATDISQSRPLFDLISKIDTTAADEPTKYSIFKTLRDFRRAGVSKDEATRQHVHQLIEDINKAGQSFDRVIREDVRHIDVTAAELKGLPQDYIDAHKAGPDGKIQITTDYPDYDPFVTYAQNDAARKALRIAARSRGYPANDPNLKDLLAKRYELATTLGYANYAAYDTEDKMVETPEKARAFLDQINAIVQEPAARDKKILLARLQKIDPSAKEVGVWQYIYLQNLLKKEQYDVDAALLRTYFPFSKVQDGILKLAESQFGLTIKPWNTPVWDPHVSAYEMYEGEKLVGRFYLDLHPRDGKYQHAANFTIAKGIEGEQVPIGALVCNFPGADDPNALMEFDDVETFLHEFGHLLHDQLGGHVAWTNNSGVATEWDFVEAPSQLRENWAYDYATLKTFAVNAKGETIPEDLVKKLNRARFFGMGIDTATQIFYASLSLDFYLKDPSSFELLPESNAMEASYAPFTHLDGTYFYDSFEHLNGYGATYYTYQWSLAIAQDMFTRFQKDGLQNQETAMAYRQDVLEPGGSAPAATLVQNFLGRPWTTDAYSAFLKRTE